MGEHTIYSKKIISLLLFFAFSVFTILPAQDVSESVSETEVALQAEGSTAEDPVLDSSEAQIQLNQSEESGTAGVWDFIRMVFVLAIVVAAIYVLFRFVKKRTMPSASSDDPFLRNVSSISLGLGKSVQIITLIDKAYIVGVSESGVSLIDKIDDRELINAMNLYNDKHADVKKPRSFSEILDIFLPPKKKDTSSGKSVFNGSTEEILEHLENQKLNTEDK